MATCKDDCEALMSAVLPIAEQMLSEHHTLQPFGSTLSSAGQIAQVGGWSGQPHATSAELLAEFEASFRDGAERGELKATALLHVVPAVAPATGEAVAVRLDHREDYSIIVTFPYRFTEAGELVIEEPYAGVGERLIFRDGASGT
jgi:hypothetical protein